MVEEASSQYLVFATICGFLMDDAGHRENGRHKAADQYKSAQGQVYENTFMLMDEFITNLLFYFAQTNNL